MEEIPIYNAYDICEHQSCQCRSCDHDKSGVCGVDKGDCVNALRTGRCPVWGCVAWIPRKAADIITTEYTIADMIRDLREAFREQYGIDASITIHAYDGPSNPQLTRETAEKLGMEMAKVFPGLPEMAHGNGATAKWFRVDPPREERVDILLFYEDEEAPHEQSN